MRQAGLSLLACAAATPAAAGLPPQGFVDRTRDLGVAHEVATGFDRIAASAVWDWMQRGLALGDIDGDGDLDVVACGGVLPNTVLRNDGGTFTDVTDLAGIEVGDFDTAPCLADFDGDGDLDLFLAVVAGGGDGVATPPPASRLYRNDGAGRFEEVTVLAGTRGRGHSIFGQWVDLDYDGLLDLLVSEFYCTPNVFYRNNGDGTFRDESVTAGLDSGGNTHVTCVMDVDGDGFLDVLVGNDYVVGNWLQMPNNAGDLQLASQGGESWLDVSDGSGYDHKRGIMGLALGDVDYDGRLDVYKADVFDNRLAVNQGWPQGLPWLGDEQAAYGVEAAWVPWPDDPKTLDKAVAWGVAFAHFDLDPWLDLFVADGMIQGIHYGTKFSPREQRNFLFRGDGPGAGFAFHDATEELGLLDGIDDRACAVGDVERDGDLDLFVQPTVGGLRYYENQIDPQGQGWLAVRPVCRTSAPGGFGVVVRYTDSLGYPHVRQVGLDGPTAAQHENVAFFGLGLEPAVDLEVEFPSGVVLALPGVAPNQELAPVEPLLVEVSARTLPIGATPVAGGTWNAPLATLPADLFVVTAYAHDQAGTPLGEDATVTIETPGLTPLSDVVPLGGNAFRRYFLAAAAPGEHRAEVAFDGWTCRIRPRVSFYDPADSAGTDVQLVPEAVRAGSADTFDVLVAPKAAGGLSLGPGRVVAVDVPGTSLLAGPDDLGDGRYVATFGAPGSPGAYPVTVAVDGAVVQAPGPALEAGGPAVNALSEVLVEVPHENTSAAPHQLRLKYRPRDAAGNRLGPYADVQVVATPDAGSAAVVVRTDLHPWGQPDGERPFLVEKPITDPPTAVSGTLDVYLDGALKLSIPYSF